MRNTNLQAPAKSSRRRQVSSYAGLVKLLKEHYDPRPSPIVQLNRRSRLPGESVTTYVAALREIALRCDYGARRWPGAHATRQIGLRCQSQRNTAETSRGS